MASERGSKVESSNLEERRSHWFPRDQIVLEQNLAENSSLN